MSPHALAIAAGILMVVVTPCAAMDWVPIPPAAQYCDTVEALEAKLSAQHSERLAIMGTERGLGQYRLYYSDHSGSWSMAWVDLDGVACVRLVGKHRRGLFGVGT